MRTDRLGRPGWTWAEVLPHALVACWLTYLGFAVWQHAAASVQPPVYDPLGYLQKAMNFWAALGAGRIVDALKVEPLSRPHGTIVMSYPFGFAPDFHGYYFRSAYLPILLSAAAVYVAAGRRFVREAGWWVASVALLFSSLPMFYQFDWLEATATPVRWGLVDNFQAGVAALAVAMLWRSLEGRSPRWLAGAAVLGALTLLVKPSGAMVMVLVALLWAAAVTAQWARSRRADPSEISALRAYGLHGAAVLLVVYSLAVAFCLFSGYFAPSNFVYAKQSFLVAQDVLRISLSETLALFHQSSGEALVVWCVAVGALAWRPWRAAEAGEARVAAVARWSVLGGLLAWAAGAWYWLVVQPAGNQIRYFFPFMLMGALCFAPAAFEGWARTQRRAQMALIAVCLLPAMNVAALLAPGGAPSIAWQRASGVSVTIGADRDEVSQAYALLDVLRAQKRSAVLYSFGNGVLPAVFENVGMYEEIVRPELPVFRVARPQDWVNGFVVRTGTLANSDYLLIRKLAEQDARAVLARTRLDSFDAENAGFELWLSTLTTDSGVETVSQSPNLRLLRVVDKEAFGRAIDRFVAAHEWRPEFTAANPTVWGTADALPRLARQAGAKNVVFEGTYDLHALAVGRANDDVTVDVWWEELRSDPANAQRFLFLHVVDDKGEILLKNQIPLFPYEPPDGQRRLRHDRVTFNVAPVRERTALLGFGVYQPNGEFLRGDGVRSDWGGKRLLVPIGGESGGAGRVSGADAK